MSSDHPQIPSLSAIGAEVRGYSASRRPASVPLRSLAFFTDVGFALFVGLLTLIPLHVSPLPRLWWLPAELGALLAISALSRLLFRRTPGEWTWRLRLETFAPWWSRRLTQSAEFHAEALGAAATLTLLVWTGSLWTWQARLFHDPLLVSGETWKLTTFLPPLGASGGALGATDWLVTPFFYALGAWPKTFRGHPVFYSLPYEKGPPTRFAGHLIARWEMPDIKLVIEGPKTPALPVSREELSPCIVQGGWSCLKLREAALTRHIEEMSRIGPHRWSLRWFVVESPSLTKAEQTQGVYLRAENQLKIQERYILISSRGNYQAFILNSPPTTEGDFARDTLQQAIRSLRIADDLNAGRVWVDQRLQSVNLKDVQASDTPSALMSRMAEIQALLLAKISVDPGTYDTYFHLGGTAILLARYLKAHPEAGGASEMSPVIKPLLQSVFHFAQDINAADPRTTELQNFWMEIQHY